MFLRFWSQYEHLVVVTMVFRCKCARVAVSFEGLVEYKKASSQGQGKIHYCIVQNWGGNQAKNVDNVLRRVEAFGPGQMKVKARNTSSSMWNNPAPPPPHLSTALRTVLHLSTALRTVLCRSDQDRYKDQMESKVPYIYRMITHGKYCPLFPVVPVRLVHQFSQYLPYVRSRNC